MNNDDDKLRNIKESLLAVMRESRRWLLLVGTGTSVAMDADLGMPALARYLLGKIPDNTDGWKSIAQSLEQENDLETALTGINLTKSLQNMIAKETAFFVAQTDGILRDDILSGKQLWVGEPLLRQLMRGLSSTWPRLPVVTPNYDMLIEYACSRTNIPYITGHHGGIIKRQNWSKARERLYRLNSVTMGGKRRDTIVSIACIELMKVHGSINLFRNNSEGTFIESDIWTAGCPSGYTPMVAPPGATKTENLYNYHDCLFSEALRAIDKATAFFVIGYGFRDQHIHQKILERAARDNCPLIVLTRDPSKVLESLPAKGDKVWIITGIQNQTTSKTDSTGTRVANSNQQLSGDFNGISLWESDVFTKQILGG